MASRLLARNRMMVGERLAIGLLRGAYPAELGTAERRAFDHLKSLAHSAVMMIFAPENAYVGQDEIRLLAGLAVFQRQRPSLEIDFDAELRHHLQKGMYSATQGPIARPRPRRCIS